MISFTVYGRPEPQGSTRAFLPRGCARPVITSDNSKLKPWRQELAQTAMVAIEENGAKIAARGVPISMALTFFFEKPRSERKSATHKATRPDLDKLLRAVLDALTGIVYADDSQVCDCCVTKTFGSPARVEIEIRTLAEGLRKTAKIPSLELIETARPVSGEAGLRETHDFGRAG